MVPLILYTMHDLQLFTEQSAAFGKFIVNHWRSLEKLSICLCESATEAFLTSGQSCSCSYPSVMGLWLLKMVFIELLRILMWAKPPINDK